VTPSQGHGPEATVCNASVTQNLPTLPRLTYLDAGRLVFGIFASIAEFERELTRGRVRSGLAAAKARGNRIGRPNSDVDVARIVQLHAAYLRRVVARDRANSRRQCENSAARPCSVGQNPIRFVACKCFKMSGAFVAMRAGKSIRFCHSSPVA
jgi:hypothetical protein